MWNKIVNELKQYDSAVLTGVDNDGYAFSVRCHPQPIAASSVFVIDLPHDTPIVPGPASLMCHHHDEHLADLRNFAVRGVLEPNGQGWLFHPRQYIPGLSNDFRAALGIFDIRRRVNEYLEKRGLSRPQIQWDELERAKKHGRNRD